MDMSNRSSDEEDSNSKKRQLTRHSHERKHLKMRKDSFFSNENEKFAENHRSEENVYSKSFGSQDDDSDGDISKRVSKRLAKNHRRHAANTPQHDRRHENEDVSSRRRKKRSSLELQEFSEDLDYLKESAVDREKKRSYNKHYPERRRSHRSHDHDYFAGKVRESKDGVEKSHESPERWKASG